MILYFYLVIKIKKVSTFRNSLLYLSNNKVYNAVINLNSDLKFNTKKIISNYDLDSEAEWKLLNKKVDEITKASKNSIISIDSYIHELLNKLIEINIKRNI